MEIDRVALTLSLLQQTCVYLVIAYLLSKTPLFTPLSQMSGALPRKLLCYVTFSMFCIMGTLLGLNVGDAVANTRAIGAVLSGLLGGAGGRARGGPHRRHPPLFDGRLDCARLCRVDDDGRFDRRSRPPLFRASQAERTAVLANAGGAGRHVLRTRADDDPPGDGETLRSSGGSGLDHRHADDRRQHRRRRHVHGDVARPPRDRRALLRRLLGQGAEDRRARRRYYCAAASTRRTAPASPVSSSRRPGSARSRSPTAPKSSPLSASAPTITRRAWRCPRRIR